MTTLTGPGGVGKTAMAMTVAAACADDFTDGVTIVLLGSLRSAELVAAEVAAQLGLPRSGGLRVLATSREPLWIDSDGKIVRLDQYVDSATINPIMGA